MLFSIKTAPTPMQRPRVTPDPGQAAALELKRRALSYHPQNGFHRDQAQHRTRVARR